jgi:poly-gamma-glutamate biosynthesis protein PgsC/CapC
MIMTSVGIGLVLSFLFAEVTGLSSGGLIVPGYLALYIDQPARIIATLAVALATYLLVVLFSRFVILYGRRRFMAMVLTGFWLGWLLIRYSVRLSFASQELAAVGYIIPGLIANEAAKQGVIRTFAAVLLISAAVRMLLMLQA